MRVDAATDAADVAGAGAVGAVDAAGAVGAAGAAAPGAIGRGAAVVTTASEHCLLTNVNEPAAQAAGFVL